MMLKIKQMLIILLGMHEVSEKYIKYIIEEWKKLFGKMKHIESWVKKKFTKELRKKTLRDEIHKEKRNLSW